MAKRKMLMAKRKMLFHPDYVREKIRASQLINRLHKCAFGEISLTMTQLRAIEILLRKCIPDLAAAEIKSEQTRRYVVEVLPVLDRDEWQEKYGAEPELATAEPTVIWTSGNARSRQNEIRPHAALHLRTTRQIQKRMTRTYLKIAGVG